MRLPDALYSLSGLKGGRLCESTPLGLTAEAGFWAGMTLYPVTKCTPQRAADIIEMYGPDRLLANSAGDWGPSKPTAIPDLIFEMRRRGHSESLIRKVVYENPLEFFSQSQGFNFIPPESEPAATT